MKKKNIIKIGNIVSFEEYLNHPGLSSSNLKEVYLNPFKYALNVKKEKSAAMILGSLIHCAILEPELLYEKYFVVNNIHNNNIENLKKDHPYKEIIDCTFMDKALQIQKNVYKRYSFIKNNGYKERSFFTDKHNIYNNERKCRVDYFNLYNRYIIDIKTTINASPEGFSRSVSNFFYYMQAAWYIQILKDLGYQINKFFFLAIETIYPFMMGIYELDLSYIQYGYRCNEVAVKIFNNMSIINNNKGIYMDIKSLYTQGKAKFTQIIKKPMYLKIH